MRNRYEKDLNLLYEMFTEMGLKTQEVIRTAVESLKEQDIEKANLAIKFDDEVDELELEIEQSCLRLIALQQPIAKDLRLIGTILKAITDIERIGDYGVNIARATLAINYEKLIKPLVDIPKMSSIAEEMLSRSIESFINEDVELAKEVAMMDDEVDELYIKIYDEIIEIIVRNPLVVKQAMELLLVARHLERIADHTTNICERVIYMVTGERVEIN